MKRALSVLIILIVGFTITSCKKKGCIDSDADNYNSEAVKDNGTCSYNGSVMFWYLEPTSIVLVNTGAETLTYKVNGVVIGTSLAAEYTTIVPFCGQPGAMSVTHAIGNDKKKSFNYSITDQTGYEHFGGTTNFSGGACLSIKLKL